MVPIHTAGLCPGVRTDLEPQISVDTTDANFSKFAYYLNFALLNNSFSSSQQTNCDSLINMKYLMVLGGKNYIVCSENHNDIQTQCLHGRLQSKWQRLTSPCLSFRQSAWNPISTKKIFVKFNFWDFYSNLSMHSDLGSNRAK